jgi:hypothetical protein
LDEEAVRIVPVRQRDTQSGHTSSPEAAGDLLCGPLTALVGVGIEGQVDSATVTAQLVKLARVEIAPQRAGDVVKAGLPQEGEIERAWLLWNDG